MAEAIALLGVTAAGIQCAQVGVQLLMLGSSLFSKLQDAPDKVKKWLDEIEQLVALAELVKDCAVVLSPSSFVSAVPVSPLPARPAMSWVEAALRGCTSQAQDLQDTLKEMLHEADDGKGQKIWKKIMTVKMETRITNSLNEIEQQKSMLNMWLGQNNLQKLGDLHCTVADVRDGVEKVNCNMLHMQQTFQEEIRNLAITVQNSSSVAISGFEHLRNSDTSSIKTLEEQLQQHHNELQSKDSILQSQLRGFTQEMRAMKDEVRKLSILQTQVSRTPSLLKEALQKYPSSQAHRMVQNSNSKYKRIKQYSGIAPQPCSCCATSRLGVWNFGINFQMALMRRNMHQKSCPAYRNTKGCSAALRFHLRTTILENTLKLSFEATSGAGGFSIGVLLRTYRRVHKHSLLPFFKDLYCYSTRKSRYRNQVCDNKARDALVKLTHRELWRAFNSGLASPDDIDSCGKSLIQLQILYSGTTWDSEYRLCAQIIKLLLSMGVKGDISDDRFYTALEMSIIHRTRQINTARDNYIDADILEWTGIRPHTVISGDIMVDCMRRWPESIEEWGYPYICDILLRKSKADLEAFISCGMKPIEETPRNLTPLHLAAAANWPEAVGLLISAGANKLAQDSELFLPIDFAIRTNCLKSVELLLKGDSTLQFITPRQLMFLNIPWFMPWFMICAEQYCDADVINAISRTLPRLRHSWKAIEPYHHLGWGFSPSSELHVALAERLFAAGFQDLELQDQNGMTALMRACEENSLRIVEFLLGKGASLSTPHRDSALTAGHFFAGSWGCDEPSKFSNTKLCAQILQTAFDATDNIRSYCLCSPEGFTPTTALMRSQSRQKRDAFGRMMLCLQLPTIDVEQQARAFALGYVFDRLQMTHTCVNIYEPCRQIAEEDRIEIEIEEEEFHDQLLEVMGEYDLERVQFSSGPLEFLEFFFKMHEMDLPSNIYHSKVYNWNDKDLLGPGKEYQSYQRSFTGKWIYFDHVEEVNEENMLALLFN